MRSTLLDLKYLLPALPVLAYFGLLWLHAVNIPYHDDYDNILGFFHLYDQAATPGELFWVFISQHNEHRPLWNRLVTFFCEALHAPLDLRCLIVFGNLALVGLFLLIIRQYRGHPQVYLFALLAALLIFQPGAYESMFWAMAALSNYYVLLFALLSFHYLFRPGKASPALAILFACMSFYTQANGLFALLIGTAYATLTALRARGGWARALPWIGVTAAALLLYLSGYRHPPHHPSLAQDLANFPNLLEHFLALLGSGAAYGQVPLALAAGLALLGGWGYLAYKRYFLRQPALFAFGLFLLGSAALISLGRSGFGVAQALGSRYHNLSVYLLLLCALGVLDVVARRRPLPRFPQVLLACLAAGYALSMYAIKHDIIVNQHRRLEYGAALYQKTGSPLELLYPIKEHARNFLEYTDRRGYYRLPALDHIDVPPMSKDNRLRVQPMQFSIDDYRPARGEALARDREGSLDLVEIKGTQLRLAGWTAAAKDEYIDFYVGVPVLPYDTQHWSVSRPDVAKALGSEDFLENGFEIVLSYPPGTDLQTVKDGMCLAYRSDKQKQFTLLGGGNPGCARLLEK